jgi:hypothetical protein
LGACPFNQNPWPSGEDFPGVDELIAFESPEDVVQMGYEVIGQEMFSRFLSIPEDRLSK